MYNKNISKMREEIISMQAYSSQNQKENKTLLLHLSRVRNELEKKLFFKDNCEIQ